MNNNKEKEKAQQFIKELYWLMNDYKDVDIKVLFDKNLEENEKKIFKDYIPKNENAFFLVGALPKLLMNETLFPHRVDLYRFSKKYLEKEINRYDKKSRKQIIGSIVCEIANTKDDSKLEKVSEVLKKLLIATENKNKKIHLGIGEKY